MIVIPDNILVKGMINRQIMVSPGFFFFHRNTIPFVTYACTLEFWSNMMFM